jgi:hypothetical protein
VSGASVFFEASVLFPGIDEAAGPPITKVIATNVNGGSHEAYVDRNGKVFLPGLMDGSYIVDVVATGFMFNQYRLDIRTDSTNPASLSILSNRMPLPAPWKLIPIGQANYYQQRKPFSIRSVLLSPYGLMGSAFPCDNLPALCLI